MKKTFLFLLLVLIIFMIYLLINMFNFDSVQLQSNEPEYVEIDSTAVSNLQKSIRIKTVSYDDSRQIDSHEFLKFETFLDSAYSILFENCDVIKFRKNSYLFAYRGTDIKLKPALFLAHYDVVPVIEENKDRWNADPFSAEIINQQIIGRGALDNKFAVISILEALKHLIIDGIRPKRSILIALGHDEETSGKGAQRIAAYLNENDVQAEYILDEGYMITDRIIPGIDNEVAMIGIAEKGYASFELAVDVDGGHSAIPAQETAVDLLSAAIHRLNTNDFEPNITEPVHHFLQQIGPEMPFFQKLLFANQSIFSQVIANEYAKTRAGQAMVKTTMVPTLFNAGIKENVVPSQASVALNFRILPGHPITDIEDHIRKTVNDSRVQIKRNSFLAEASPVSDISHTSYKNLAQTIRNHFPNVHVAPNLVVAATDSRHFTRVSNQIYRFVPYRLNSESMGSIHGINESASINEFIAAVRFYIDLMKL